MHRLRRWKWVAAALVVAALGSAGGGVWWLGDKPLSAEERVFVGRWSQPITVAKPNDGRAVYQFHGDRTFRFIAVGPDGQRVQGEVAGRWAAADGVLVITCEAQPWLGPADRFRRFAQGRSRLRSERLTVVATDAAGLRLVGAGGNTLTLTPAPGE